MSRAILGAASLAVLISLVGSGAASAEGASEADVAKARELAQTFQATLKQALVGAMSEGGPPNAISVCSVRAPEIAGSLSEASGWQVARTALRVRNPGNAPTPREAEVLKAFQEKIAAGAAPKSLETTVVVDTDEGRKLHYMKAIPMGEVCATCHGKDVNPDLLKTIRETYPQDEAVGFEPGELRGAFTFYKPLKDG